MMEPPLQYYEIVEEQPLPGMEISKPLLVEAEWPVIEDKETEHSKTPCIAKAFTSISSLSDSALSDTDFSGDLGGGGGGNSPRSVWFLAEPKMVRSMRILAEQTPIQHILQPPTIASLVAIVIGMVPQLKGFVFGYDAPLSFVADSLEILGGAMVPSVILILGGMLAEGPNEQLLGYLWQGFWCFPFLDWGLSQPLTSWVFLQEVMPCISLSSCCSIQLRVRCCWARLLA